MSFSCCLNMSMQHWTKLMETGDKPPARCDHAACCVAGPLTGQQSPILMVVGGHRGKALGDVWLLDVDKGVWSEVCMFCVIVYPATDRHADSYCKPVYTKGRIFYTLNGDILLCATCNLSVHNDKRMPVVQIHAHIMLCMSCAVYIYAEHCILPCCRSLCQ